MFAAGIGSLLSGKLGISPHKLWTVPFVGVLASSLMIFLVYQQYFELFLQSPTLVRIIAASALIFPLGLFLGMPFPLGILTIEKQPRGSIAWAWAMNGLFTVIGGLGSVLLSIYYGFQITLIVAMLIYVCAFFMYSRLRAATVGQPA